LAYPPERIVCLTEETVEALYLMERDSLIAGVTGYAVRPARVRKEKPRVAAFTSANKDKILALRPDLVLAFSDLQADIAADLIRAGVAVHCFNQRTVAGIFDMVLTLGALVDARDKAVELVSGWRGKIELLKASSPARRPRVYFEEWDEPMITGIGWVSELIEVAGGEDCFAPLRVEQAAKDRIIQPEDVIAAAPDIIIGSWCGKKFVAGKVMARPGWEAIPAVRNGQVHEIKSPLILQPGPAALGDGLDALVTIVTSWQQRHV
jgi:iron complex transport system substrate-binding protein